MSKGTLYISGKMRGLKFYNAPKFDYWKKHLENEGWEVISPMDTDRSAGLDPYDFPEDHDWSIEPAGMDMRETAKRDVVKDIINKADAVFMIDGWETSVGALAEYWAARFSKIPIIHETEPNIDPLYWSQVRVAGMYREVNDG